MFATRTLAFATALFFVTFLLFNATSPAPQNPFGGVQTATPSAPVGELGPGMEPEG